MDWPVAKSNYAQSPEGQRAGEKVAAASAKQSEPVAQIGGAMARLTSASQQHAADTEKLSADAEQMQMQMQTSVSFFQTNQSLQTTVSAL